MITFYRPFKCSNIFHSFPPSSKNQLGTKEYGMATKREIFLNKVASSKESGETVGWLGSQEDFTEFHMTQSHFLLSSVGFFLRKI